MAKIVHVVDAVDERNAVRATYKTAHCRRIKDRKGFFVFYTNEFNNQKIIGHSDNSRADAWRDAFIKAVANKFVTKLES